MFTFPTTFFGGNLSILPNGLLTGLVAYYGLDSNANDAHGSNNGTATGVTRDTASKVLGTASGDFPLTTSKIDFANITINNKHTINLWLNFSGSNGTASFPYSSRTSNPVIDRTYIYVQNGDVFFQGGATTAPLQSGFNDSSWHMATLTKDGNTYKYYIDGVYLGTFTDSNTINTLVNVSLGYLGYANSNPYNGSIDEFGVRDTPLTDTQITTLYNGGSGLAYSDFTI